VIGEPKVGWLKMLTKPISARGVLAD